MRPSYTAEYRRNAARLYRQRWLALKAVGAISSAQAGDDEPPSIMAAGSDRARFNLGNGARWKRPRRQH